MPTATYDTIYERQKAGDPLWKGYGHSNHGAHLSPWLVNWCAARLLDRADVTVIDLGCGHNEFVKGLRENNGIFGVGVDSSCPGADIRADITNAPACRKAVIEYCAVNHRSWLRGQSLVVSFDTLEHVAEADLDAVFSLMRELAPSFCLSIGYEKAEYDLDGENLHPTARPQEWWMERLRLAGATIIELPSTHLVGRWKD